MDEGIFDAMDRLLASSPLSEPAVYAGRDVRVIVLEPAQYAGRFGSSVFPGGQVIDVLADDVDGEPATGDSVVLRGETMSVVGEGRRIGSIWRVNVR